MTAAVPRVRVLIADDHTMVRAGLRKLLEQHDWLDVVGEAGDGISAVEAVMASPVDVVLMDISMPRLNGLEAARRIRRERPAVRIIILSMHSNEEYVLQALQIGVNGYLLKDAATSELEIALRAVGRDDIYLSPGVSRRVVAYGLDRAQARGTSLPRERLTPRQREVLQLLAEGNSMKQIAGLLGLSSKTIETHRAQIMERLGIHDIPGLVRYAVRNGIVAADS